MASGLPPPPVNDAPGSFTWLEWYRQLRNYVSTSGSVPWYIINFSGSNITDIASRSHNQLQTLQGGSSNEMYHLTLSEHSRLNNYLEQLTDATGVVLPTTPTLFKPTTLVKNVGITYDAATGEYTFINGGSFSLNISMNATPSAAGKSIYFYADIDTGTGWVPLKYSGRGAELVKTTSTQTVFTASVNFAAGTKTRNYVWASSNTITLNSENLPGITPGTVLIPAIRFSLEGGL